MPTEQETTQQIIANSKSVPQLPEVFSFEDGDYIPLFNVTTQQLVKIKKSNIVFTGEPITTINGLTDTPSSKLGQAGKVILVSQDELTHEYKLLSEVQGITAQSIIDALTYTPADRRLDALVSDLTTAEKDVIDGKLFKEITLNQYGTHPAFTNQADLNAWLLGNSSSGGATTLNSPTGMSATATKADSNKITWNDTNS